MDEPLIIVGHSEKIIGQGKGSLIDSFSTIIRMNRAVPLSHAKDLGKRTDILFLSVLLSSQEIAAFAPHEVVWATPRDRTGIPLDFSVYNLQHWDELSGSLGGKRPSTGLMAIDWAIRQKKAHPYIIGFDGFETKTWYRDSQTTPHDGKAEKRWIYDQQLNGKLSVLD